MDFSTKYETPECGALFLSSPGYTNLKEWHLKFRFLWWKIFQCLCHDDGLTKYVVSKICDRKISLNDENNYHKSQHHYTAEPVMAEPTAVDFGSCRYMLQCSLKQKT